MDIVVDVRPEACEVLLYIRFLGLRFAVGIIVAVAFGFRCAHVAGRPQGAAGQSEVHIPVAGMLAVGRTDGGVGKQRVALTGQFDEDLAYQRTPRRTAENLCRLPVDGGVHHTVVHGEVPVVLVVEEYVGVVGHIHDKHILSSCLKLFLHQRIGTVALCVELVDYHAAAVNLLFAKHVLGAEHIGGDAGNLCAVEYGIAHIGNAHRDVNPLDSLLVLSLCARCCEKQQHSKCGKCLLHIFLFFS